MMWSGDHVANEKRYISTTTSPMAATKHDTDVASDERTLFRKSNNQLITWTHQLLWQKKHYISISTRPVASKFVRMAAHCKEPWTTNLSVFSITCSRDFTWQIKNVIFLLSRGLWPLNMTRQWLMRRGHHPRWSHDIISTTPMAIKLEKMLGCITHRVTWFFDQVILCSLKTNKKRFVSSATSPPYTTRERVVIFDIRLPHKKSHHSQ